MIEFSVVRLEPTSPFHLGEKGVGMEETAIIIHSDTLFSAICNAFSTLFGKEELEATLDKFSQSPPFLITSGYIYVNKVLTFPMPLALDWRKYGSMFDFQTIKKLKEVKYVSEKIFRDLLLDMNKIGTHVGSENVKQGILFSDEEAKEFDIPNIYRKSTTPRIVFDRKTHTSDIYHFGEIFFGENCGLFFLVDYKNTEYRQKIEASIRLLGDEGIGGDRTSGRGLFTPEFKKISFAITDTKSYETLSLTYPKESEIELIKAGFYSLISRAGWIYSRYHKNLRWRTIRMLGEGSVFGGKASGMLVDVTPVDGGLKHKIYRYGYSFLLPLGGGL